MKYIVLVVLCLFTFQFTIAQIQPDGPYKKYYDSGELLLEGQYLSNKRASTWKSYYKNGQVKSIYSYKDGKQNKDFISYYEDGSLKSKTEKEDDTYIKRSFYKSGELKTINELGNGYFKKFLKNGKLLVESTYSNSELSGEWKQFYENGQIAWIVTYKDGYRHGMYKQYYENGDIKLEGNISKDKVNGQEKRFLKNRELEWTGTYQKGQLHGTWTKFNAEGSKPEKIKFKNGLSSNKEFRKIITPTKVPDGVTQRIPIYPGCEKALTNRKRKTCMNNNVSAFILKNFNTNLAKGLLPGKKRIFIKFKANKKGEIEVIDVAGPTPSLKLEAYRVIKMLPKVVPAMQDGKLKNFPFSIPIVFQVTR
ncbi:toxin-antitoxin system YwqK family antitoxin [uncultured Winogradskyella sp.]|uniref:toxin-antitoxin system YwqK family antitoxin n=1 Tax=uncultured Winogradskyella sp. TaxID=395353 RepID=UPI00260CE78D|nr:toxin-antitoxin system YwqK family antitoxin [uncultured Winogradskyella sp.]